jgi:hypothetical protein
MRSRILLCVAFVAAVCLGAFSEARPAGAAEIKLTVQGEASGSGMPVRAAVTLPKELAGLKGEQIRAELRPAGGSHGVPGQVVASSAGRAELWWVLPVVRAGEKQTWTATLAKGAPAAKEAFSWKDTPGKHLDLLFAARPVTRYMYACDRSDKNTRFNTGKCFHHVFNEAGTDTITKGTGGLYPHHRGIFIGFSRLAYDGNKRDDWWHVRRVMQVHQEHLEQVAGPVLAAGTTLIHWNDPADKPVVKERRRVVVYRQSRPTLLLLDFRSQLEPARGDIRLDGDPEHAGMQFRPHNDVDRKATKYLFPKKEITRGNVKKQRDLPWAAETIVLKGKKYSVQHMNHPDNPKGTVYSAYRDYGRFGAFFKKDVKQGEKLTVRYRIWVVPGEMPARERLQTNWQAFATPPTAAVAK